MKEIAQLTHGLAGAEIENIINLAALQSVRKARSMKINDASLEGQEFLDYVKGFMNDKRKTANVGMSNQS